MRIYLVRHAKSKANEDWTVNTDLADHSIPLSEIGETQPAPAGKFLAHYIKNNHKPKEWFQVYRSSVVGELITHLCPKIISNFFVYRPRIRFWNSPYLRTRQTLAAMFGSFLEHERAFYSDWEIDHQEHMLLAEQQFGLFDGLSDEDRAKLYPEMVAHYDKCKKAKGKMWPKMPMGESRFEVCQRTHQSFGTFHRDCEKHGIDTIVVVIHGTTLRAFVTMWLHKNYEWMHEEPNPKNCAIRLIEEGIDRGYIYAGND